MENGSSPSTDSTPPGSDGPPASTGGTRRRPLAKMLLPREGSSGTRRSPPFSSGRPDQDHEYGDELKNKKLDFVSPSFSDLQQGQGKKDITETEVLKDYKRVKVVFNRFAMK